MNSLTSLSKGEKVKAENGVKKNNSNVFKLLDKHKRNNLNSRNGFIHLYNPENEGLGSYDVHYINAYNKNNKKRTKQKETNKERSAA